MQKNLSIILKGEIPKKGPQNGIKLFLLCWVLRRNITPYKSHLRKSWLKLLKTYKSHLLTDGKMSLLTCRTQERREAINIGGGGGGGVVVMFSPTFPRILTKLYKFFPKMLSMWGGGGGQ